MVSLKKLTYKIIPGLLDQKEISILKKYCREKHINNYAHFDFQHKNADTGFYKDELMQVFLNSKKSIIEKAVGLELYETYSFWRCYTFGADLKKHKDRPPCEISVTICIDSDKGKWPIFIGSDPVNLNPGDGVIYNACKIEHSREVYEGDYHMQLFLHYVNKNGRYAHLKGDKGMKRT